MPQFAVYHNENSQTKKLVPYLLDVQADLLADLQTSVVVPLIAADKNKAISRLTPILTVDGTEYLMLTPQLAGIMRKELGKPVTTLTDARNEIIGAIDFLATGF